MRDFTHAAYETLLLRLLAAGYRFSTIADAVWATGHDEPHLILRHDVDRLPQRAVALARIEHRLGIPATYYFRTRRCSFNRSAIRRIHGLGHEIGYHYECLADSRGDRRKARTRFEREYRRFDFIGGVRSISMHGRPFSAHDSRDLWNDYDYRAFGVEREAYLDVPWEVYSYFTDTGGCWDSAHNIRDRPVDAASARQHRPHSTAELIALLTERRQPAVISSHPERWASRVAGWMQVRATDWATNGLKGLIRGRR